jgi:hypothetical protein
VKERTFGKTHGIKARCYWGTPLRNTVGTWEFIGNLMGTHWGLEGNKGKMKNFLPPTPLQNLKEKKIKAL